MRFNDEVPDYYLDDGNSTNAGKGYYMYDDVYYVSVPIEKKRSAICFRREKL